MDSKNKHKWTKVDTDIRPLAKYICDICKCKRYTSFAFGKTFHFYSREKMMYDHRPDCFGPIPINQQTID